MCIISQGSDDSIELSSLPNQADELSSNIDSNKSNVFSSFLFFLKHMFSYRAIIKRILRVWL